MFPQFSQKLSKVTVQELLISLQACSSKTASLAVPGVTGPTTPSLLCACKLSRSGSCTVAVELHQLNPIDMENWITFCDIAMEHLRKPIINYCI